ncbi:MAG TPA: alcohol dehydrogenase catalytic domain-containing protein [Bacteroidales bacterium]|nr:alcohol dehydrogenase catalytic domain-containing protein [Bacteroidales bacterium]HQG35688.1 alcohol dehydrogenase catalytic domain-containing protein [Bacteroidales bacterium]HQG51998.1 alcohol dehydrogenase catalytic domain-containing protein [Bacteroidales bacterium]HQJ19694.1 alcohol dehydrogenase catalytic domain-containing protein [Bacteroidales bacterium]
MKSMVLTGIREIKMVEKPIPEITTSNEVLIRINSVGICGSDIHYYNEGRIGSQVIEFPFTIGHECSGIIEKTGSSVKKLKPGDRVAVDPAMPCFACSQCRERRYHTCLNIKFLGCPGQAEGCLSEYIVMPESSCYKIDESISFDMAALSEPLSIGLYATELAGTLQNKNIGILGSGPIGLSVLLMANSKKAGKIYMTDLIDERLELAKHLGACRTWNPSKTDIVDELMKDEPDLLDMVFECCGKQEAVEQALRILKPGGMLLIVGIPSSNEWRFSAEVLRRKEITIRNVRRQNEMVRPTLDLISNGIVKPEKMITHIFDFKQTQQAFELVAGYRDGVMKAMVHI